MNGHYDYGFTTNVSVPDRLPTPNQIPQGQTFYGHSATPLFPQASQQLGYDHQYAQQVLSLQEQCKSLEAQLFKVTTECDTMRTLLDQLSASLQNQHTATPMAAPVRTREMFPLLRFWLQEDFNNWTNSAEAHADPHYKMAYLEDEQGRPVSDQTIKAMRKKLRGGWTDLANKRKAGRSWGKTSTSAKEELYAAVYKSFPYLQLAENDWKLELLCSTDYPGWVRNNLDAQGNWLVKQEDDATPGQESVSGASKKRKAKTGTTFKKRMKIDPQESQAIANASVNTSFSDPLGLGSNITSEATESAGLALSPDNNPSHDISTDASSANPSLLHASSQEDITLTCSSHSSSAGPVSSPTGLSSTSALADMLPLSSVEAVPVATAVSLSPPSTDTVSSPSGPLSQNISTSPDATPDTPPLLSVNVISTSTNPPHKDTASIDSPHSSADTTSTPTIASHTSVSMESANEIPNLNDTVSPPDAEPAKQEMDPRSKEHIVVDPVASLNKKSLKIKIPPLPLLPPRPEMVVDKKSEQDNNGEGSNTTGPSSSKRKGASSRKMRVGKNPTAYNLCALRWLAQINENGTSDDFRAYWNKHLNADQRNMYKNEAKELVEKDSWNDNVSAGTVY